MNDSTVSAPWVKLISVWTAFGITSWTEAAGAAATFYSCLLIAEWFFKKLRSKD